MISSGWKSVLTLSRHLVNNSNPQNIHRAPTRLRRFVRTVLFDLHNSTVKGRIPLSPFYRCRNLSPGKWSYFPQVILLQTIRRLSSLAPPLDWDPTPPLVVSHGGGSGECTAAGEGRDFHPAPDVEVDLLQSCDLGTVPGRLIVPVPSRDSWSIGWILFLLRTVVA